jgi:hypothetical protein
MPVPKKTRIHRDKVYKAVMRIKKASDETANNQEELSPNQQLLIVLCPCCRSQTKTAFELK